MANNDSDFKIIIDIDEDLINKRIKEIETRLKKMKVNVKVDIIDSKSSKAIKDVEKSTSNITKNKKEATKLTIKQIKADEKMLSIYKHFKKLGFSNIAIAEKITDLSRKRFAIENKAMQINNKKLLTVDEIKANKELLIIYKAMEKEGFKTKAIRQEITRIAEKEINIQKTINKIKKDQEKSKTITVKEVKQNERLLEIYQELKKEGYGTKSALAQINKIKNNEIAIDNKLLSIAKKKTKEEKALRKELEASESQRMKNIVKASYNAPTSSIKSISKGDYTVNQSTGQRDVRATQMIANRLKLEKAINAEKKSRLNIDSKLTKEQQTILILYKKELASGKTVKNARKSILETMSNTRNMEQQLLDLGKKRRTMVDSIGRALMGQVAMYLSINQALSKLNTGFSYLSEMDKSITTIRMVNKEFAKMERTSLVEEFESVAQAIGKTSQEVGRMSEALARQGLAVDEIRTRTEMFTKIAAVLGEDAGTITNDMTALINAFNLEDYDPTKGQELQTTIRGASDIITKLGAVAATSGSEIFTAMQKSAAGADGAGVKLGELARYITIISETTREPAEAIGNSLKTILARFQQLKNMEGDFGNTLASLESVGITVYADDTKETIRDVSALLDDLAGKWYMLTDVQQKTIASALGINLKVESHVIAI